MVMIVIYVIILLEMYEPSLSIYKEQLIGSSFHINLLVSSATDHPSTLVESGPGAAVVRG
jgi:hypothetical protein